MALGLHYWPDMTRTRRRWIALAWGLVAPACGGGGLAEPDAGGPADDDADIGFDAASSPDAGDQHVDAGADAPPADIEARVFFDEVFRAIDGSSVA